MKVTRRGVMAGAAALPTLAALGDAAWAQTRPLTGIYDERLPAGQSFAAVLGDHGHTALAVAGDRVRLARQVLGEQVPLLAGVTRSADALLFAEVAAEMGYQAVLELRGNSHGCSGFTCHPKWNRLSRHVVGAGPHWLGAFAGLIANPSAPVVAAGRVADKTIATGWLLVRRA